MKKIIQSGNLDINKVYETTCDRCNCKFSYQEEDVTISGHIRVVTCPECNQVMILSNHFGNCETINCRADGNYTNKEIKEGDEFKYDRNKSQGKEV